MRLYFDLHIHTALSPCADNDMTPCNIVNMARLKGLDVIAITDHNSVANIKAAMSAGKKAGITVMAGMEIETAEEVHVLTLYPCFDAAYAVWQKVDECLPPIKNKPHIFGNQLIMDEHDNIIDSEDKLLLNAAALSVQQVFSLVKNAGGVAIPAHVDRTSNSILSNLGFIPPELAANTIEVSAKAMQAGYLKNNPFLGSYKIISNSDAHYLGDISEKQSFIEIIDNKPENIIKFFG